MIFTEILPGADICSIPYSITITYKGVEEPCYRYVSVLCFHGGGKGSKRKLKLDSRLLRNVFSKIDKTIDKTIDQKIVSNNQAVFFDLVFGEVGIYLLYIGRCSPALSVGS